MSVDEEWVSLSDFPSTADERWLRAVNGDEPPLEPEPDSWLPQNLADLDDEPPVQPTLGGLSLCYPGKRHVFSGPQESAKTLAAYVIGLSVVRTGAPVVLIDFEMGPWDAKTRLRELGATNEDLQGVAYVAPETPASESAISGLVDRQPGLVVVDAAAGAYDIQGLDDNRRADVERFTRLYVSQFWKAGIATIVLDHVVKNVEGRGNYAIGSERKVGGADVHLGFSVIKPISRGGRGAYKITTHKDRGGFLKRGLLCEFEVASDPETHIIDWAFKEPQAVDEEHEWRPTHLMEKVSRLLELQVEPISKNTILEAHLGKDAYVRKALELLQKEGHVEETPGANRALMQSLVVAYREDQDDHVSGTAQVRPSTAQETEDTSAAVRPPPFRGDVPDVPTAQDALKYGPGGFPSKDDIPF